MRLPWKLDLDLEIPGRSPGEVRDLCLRRGFRFSGLRVRVSGDRLRARYVVDAAASAPLLKARLSPTSTGTRVDGHVYLAAPIIYGAMHIVAGLLVGIGVLGAAIATRAWPAFAIGTPLLLVCGWLCIDAVRELEDQAGYRVAFEQALLEAFAHK